MKTIAHRFAVIIVLLSMTLSQVYPVSAQSNKVEVPASSEIMTAPVDEAAPKASENFPAELPAPDAATVTAAPTSTVTDIEPQVEVPLFSLSLSSSPAFLTRGGSVKLDWVIEGALPKDNEFVLQIAIPEGFEPDLKAKDSGSFDSATRILSIAAPAPQGSVNVQADNVTEDSLFSANLLNEQEVVAIASFVLPLKEEFELSAEGGNIAPLNDKVNVTFPQGALSEAVTIDFGSPTQDAAPSHSLSGQPFEIKAHGRESRRGLKDLLQAANMRLWPKEN